MATGEVEIGTDEWWVNYLLEKLGAEYPRLAKAFGYRESKNPLADIGVGAALEQYPQMLALSRLNFAEQIADAVISKCAFVGFRTAAQDDDDGDEVAERISHLNRLSSQYPLLAESKATYSRGYMTVLEASPDDGPDAPPSIVVTDAWRTVTEQNPAKPWESVAALTIGWNAATQTDTVMLFRAGEGPDDTGYMRVVSRFDEGGQSQFPSKSVDAAQWSLQPTPENGWEWGPVTKFEKVRGCGVVLFTTRDGYGLYEKHYDTLDRVNQTILHRIVVSITQAFKKHAIEGADLPEVYPEGHPQSGEPIDWNEVFKNGPDALWLLPAGAKMWESQAMNLDSLVGATQAELRNLAAVTGTPLYVLDPAAANGSASGADLARDVHLSKVRAWRDSDQDSLAQVLSFAFQAIGDEERAAVEAISTIWLQITTFDLHQQASAAKMATEAGMSSQFIGERIWALSPADMRRERAAKQSDGFAAGAMGGGFSATPAPASGAVGAPAATPAAPASAGSLGGGLL